MNSSRPLKLIFVFPVVIAALLTLAVLVAPVLVRRSLPQFVLLTFDGGGESAVWKRTLEFAEHHQVRFTYFVSGARLSLPGEYGMDFANVQFAESEQEISELVRLVSEAAAAGHEIASHGYAHFHKLDRSLADWQREFELFDRVLEKRFEKFGRRLEIRGFRAPHLSATASLYQIEADRGFQYDSSLGRKEEFFGSWPSRYNGEIYLFPVYGMYDQFGRKKSGMDYSSYLVDEQAETPRDRIVETTKAMYLAYFRRAYDTTRSPLTIITHFTPLSDGAYQDAMFQFAEQVCGLNEVKCVTVSEAVAWFDAHPFRYWVAQTLWPDRIDAAIVQEIERARPKENNN